MTAPLRVVLADDHVATRAGVRAALQADGFEVCAEVGDAASAIAAKVRNASAFATGSAANTLTRTSSLSSRWCARIR